MSTQSTTDIAERITQESAAQEARMHELKHGIVGQLLHLLNGDLGAFDGLVRSIDVNPDVAAGGPCDSSMPFLPSTAIELDFELGSIFGEAGERMLVCGSLGQVVARYVGDDPVLVSAMLDAMFAAGVLAGHLNLVDQSSYEIDQSVVSYPSTPTMKQQLALEF